MPRSGVRFASDAHMRMSRTGIVVAAIAVAVVIVGATGVTTYNKLVRLDQTATAQWAQVENAYQRRADLVPNLVATVKGAAAFEHDTLTGVTDARARVGQVAVPNGGAANAEQFKQYQQAQDLLGSALSRLLVVSEAYPTLTATQNFRDLQAQLEGTENRIAVARRDYIEAVRVYNTTLKTFPSVLWAKFWFTGNQPFQTFTVGDDKMEVPKVDFGTKQGG